MRGREKGSENVFVNAEFLDGKTPLETLVCMDFFCVSFICYSKFSAAWKWQQRRVFTQIWVHQKSICFQPGQIPLNWKYEPRDWNILVTYAFSLFGIIHLEMAVIVEIIDTKKIQKHIFTCMRISLFLLFDFKSTMNDVFSVFFFHKNFISNNWISSNVWQRTRNEIK